MRSASEMDISLSQNIYRTRNKSEIIEMSLEQTEDCDWT